MKHHLVAEVVIGGWRAGGGRQSGLAGSLLLGVPDGRGGLAYVGHVGTGFTDVMRADMAARLKPLEQQASPFAGRVPVEDARGGRWVRPALVGEVHFSEWTVDGRLRHPSWRGLRTDVRPADVLPIE
ncbi:ATP dependent DNA ligase [Nonomuraea recticatena]|uniref:DNA ligase (ATP) n=1 Tax=Nonomuraea recticatena TaxID=46178 RepID=A0ABP6E1A8_9ACTN